MQAVQHSQITFTGNTKRMGGALGQKAIDKKMAGKLFSHARYCAALDDEENMAPTFAHRFSVRPELVEECPPRRG
ncbi:hypothetical protein D9M73_100590 [compost metagenome]